MRIGNLVLYSGRRNNGVITTPCCYPELSNSCGTVLQSDFTFMPPRNFTFMLGTKHRASIIKHSPNICACHMALYYSNDSVSIPGHSHRFTIYSVQAHWQHGFWVSSEPGNITHLCISQIVNQETLWLPHSN